MLSDLFLSNYYLTSYALFNQIPTCSLLAFGLDDQCFILTGPNRTLD